jgi:hypothetical protein
LSVPPTSGNAVTASSRAAVCNAISEMSDWSVSTFRFIGAAEHAARRVVTIKRERKRTIAAKNNRLVEHVEVK